MRRRRGEPGELLEKLKLRVFSLFHVFNPVIRHFINNKFIDVLFRSKLCILYICMDKYHF